MVDNPLISMGETAGETSICNQESVWLTQAKTKFYFDLQPFFLAACRLCISPWTAASSFSLVRRPHLSPGALCLLQSLSVISWVFPTCGCPLSALQVLIFILRRGVSGTGKYTSSFDKIIQNLYAWDIVLFQNK